MSPIQLELLTNCNETFTTKEHSIRAPIYENINKRFFK